MNDETVLIRSGRGSHSDQLYWAQRRKASTPRRSQVEMWITWPCVNLPSWHLRRNRIRAEVSKQETGRNMGLHAHQTCGFHGKMCVHLLMWDFFFYQATNVFGTWKKSADAFLIGTTHQPADARISLLQTDLIQCCKVVSMFRQEISMWRFLYSTFQIIWEFNCLIQPQFLSNIWRF